MWGILPCRLNVAWLSRGSGSRNEPMVQHEAAWRSRAVEEKLLGVWKQREHVDAENRHPEPDACPWGRSHADVLVFCVRANTWRRVVECRGSI